METGTPTCIVSHSDISSSRICSPLRDHLSETVSPICEPEIGKKQKRIPHDQTTEDATFVSQPEACLPNIWKSKETPVQKPRESTIPDRPKKLRALNFDCNPCPDESFIQAAKETSNKLDPLIHEPDGDQTQNTISDARVEDATSVSQPESSYPHRWKSKKTPVQKPKESTIPHRPKKGRSLNFDCNPCPDEPLLQAAKETINTLMEPLLKVLNEGKLLYDFVLLLKVLTNGRLPCNNIALLLLLERARFASMTNSSSMYYWPETMKFWKIVYKILHGKAIRLFSGLKNVGQVIKGEARSGHYDPAISVCNFAVPEIATLNCLSETSSIKLPTEIPPGIIEPAIDLASKQKEKEFVLCVDGKKVAAGLNKKYGDIDLWGNEVGITLKDTKARLIKESNQIEKMTDLAVDKNNMSDPVETLTSLQQLATILSFRVADARHLTLAQERHVDKLKKLAENNPDNKSKYEYSMSFTQTTIFQAKKYITSTLQLISEICEMGSELNSSNHFNRGEINLSHQGNVIQLQEPSKLPEQFRKSTFVKQRTPEWFELRKLAPVTGSSLHKGIGLGTLKDQRRHCDEHIASSTRTPVSAELQARFDHGIRHEEDAVATLAGQVLPFMFPHSLGIVEDGANFIKGKNKDTLIEVSSDGILKPVHGTEVGGQSLYTVEIKCPYPNRNVLPVHYKLPKYYVCQLLAEMAAHGTSAGIYVSYSMESMTVCKVQFDTELWEMILQEVEVLYGGEKTVRLKKKTESAKEIGSRLDKFIQDNVEFILEVPSATAVSQGNVSFTVIDLPYVFPLELHVSDSPCQSKIDPIDLCGKMKECVNEGYRLTRKKATEILAFVLSDTDRIWTPEQPHHLPVAYAMKGASIKVNTVKTMVSDVRKKCEESGVKIMCESYDGQWYPLVVRDDQGSPLTKLQMQKDVWKEALALPKPKLMQFFRQLFQRGNPDQPEVMVWKDEGTCKISHTNCEMDSVFRSWRHLPRLPDSPSIKIGTKRKNAPALRFLCVKVISATYPKRILSIRYAETIFPQRLRDWEEKRPQGTGVRIRGLEDPIDFYSYVEYVDGKRYRPKVLDPSHLLVNCRVKATKDGFKGVNPKAFLAVAEADPTIVNRAIVNDALDKQSVAIAERVFSELVEKKMIDLGFSSTAMFVHFIRDWYQAIDEPGLRSIERIKKMVKFKDWLLKDVSFETFPPPGKHVKGIPFVMWEGFIQNIDTRIQLYSICENGTYN